MSGASVIVHASLVARREAGGWRGVLLRGPSGSGKSDLVLRALQSGWRLAADDRVAVWRSGARLFGCAPPALQGLCEARCLDVVRLPSIAFACIGLVADLARPDEALERLPEPGSVRLEGVDVASVRLRPLESSAVMRLELALTSAAARRFTRL